MYQTEFKSAIIYVQQWIWKSVSTQQDNQKQHKKRSKQRDSLGVTLVNWLGKETNWLVAFVSVAWSFTQRAVIRPFAKLKSLLWLAG